MLVNAINEHTSDAQCTYLILSPNVINANLISETIETNCHSETMLLTLTVS